MGTPPWLGLTLAVVGAVTGAIAVAVGLAWPWWDYVFVSDDSPVSWLSSVLLGANATVALVARFGRPARRAFGVLAAACLVMALDEHLHLHERVQVWLGDGVAAVYGGLLVAGGLTWMRAAAPRVDATVRRFLWLGLYLGAIAVGIDFAAESTTWAWTEEVWEVAAETVWLCGLLEQCRVQVQSGSST